jgi:hypothetical protein
VEITAKHRVVEARFRQLVADAELPEPDDVGYEPASVVFYWHRDKLVVCVDFDDGVTEPGPDGSEHAWMT